VKLLQHEGLLVTSRPYGTPLPAREGEELQSFREATQSGKPVISGVVIGGVSRQPAVRLEVPVLRNGTLAYMLSAGVSPACSIS